MVSTVIAWLDDGSTFVVSYGMPASERDSTERLVDRIPQEAREFVSDVAVPAVSLGEYIKRESANSAVNQQQTQSDVKETIDD